MKDRLRNVYLLAEKLRHCPANEQYLGTAFAVIAQAIIDLHDSIVELNERSNVNEPQN